MFLVAHLFSESLLPEPQVTSHVVEVNNAPWLHTLLVRTFFLNPRLLAMLMR